MTGQPLHHFEADGEYPWFCGICGYAPHEPLKHYQRSPESEKRGLARYAAKPKAERPENIGLLSAHLTASLRP